jgi:MoaA/NifB/PqqE/SkfB family radical SAM enzyme
MDSNYVMPRVFSLYVTYNCQLACSHCFLTQTGLLNQYTLSLETIKKVIREVKEHNVYMVVLSGGDPLLHPNIKEILKELNDNNIVPLLGITGIDVTIEQIDMLKLAGIKNVQVSLDGSNEERNTRFRGDNVFNNVIQSIELIQNNSLSVNLAICINKNNIVEFPNMIELCLRLKIYKVKIQIWENYNPNDDYIDLSLSEEQEKEVRELCSYYNKQKDGNWISITGGNLREQKPKGLQYPPLVLGADGSITIGEMGRIIGHISRDSLVEAYSKYYYELKKSFFNKLLVEFKNHYNISSILPVEDEKLNSNAIVYRYKDNFEIFYKDSLPLAIKIFSVIHEIGHISTNSLNSSPEYNQEIETSMNIWAIEYLKDLVTPSFYTNALSLASDEDLLFNYIQKALLSNLIVEEGYHVTQNF